jgi:hypothetical protein
MVERKKNCFVCCFSHEGRTWYTAHRGRLWIAATAKTPKTAEIEEMENHYRFQYKGEIVCQN